MRHGLWFEGAPHDDEGRRIGWQGTGGVGRAACRCGALSPVLPSGNARKEWHREHKWQAMAAVSIAPTTAGEGERGEG